LPKPREVTQIKDNLTQGCHTPYRAGTVLVMLNNGAWPPSGLVTVYVVQTEYQLSCLEGCMILRIVFLDIGSLVCNFPVLFDGACFMNDFM